MFLIQLRLGVLHVLHYSEIVTSNLVFYYLFLIEHEQSRARTVQRGGIPDCVSAYLIFLNAPDWIVMFWLV